MSDKQVNCDSMCLRWENYTIIDFAFTKDKNNRRYEYEMEEIFSKIWK